MATETQMQRKVKDTRVFISERLYEMRVKQGMSQQELGDRAGVDRKTINRIENGHFSPSIDTMVRIAAVLGVSERVLLP